MRFGLRIAALATAGVLAAALVLAPASAASGQSGSSAASSWNVATDWVIGSNPSGQWSFGWSQSRGSAFNPITREVDYTSLSVDTWDGPYYGFPHVDHNYGGSEFRTYCCFIPAGEVLVHPGPGGQNGVIRWTAPAAGTYSVSATWTARDYHAGTTTDDAVLENGSHQLYAGEVTGLTGRSSFSGEVTLAAGDTLDFTVGVGTDGSYSSDSTGVAIEIDQSDSTPPVVTVPPDITAEATGPDGAAVTFDASATDPDDAAGPVSCDHSSGDTFPLGATTVTCSSTDTHGNTGSAQFTVTVVDTTPPALSGVPGDFAVDATSPEGAVVNWAAPSAYDLVDGDVAVYCLPESGSTLAIGDTAVVCTATDAHGNEAQQSFAVHVRGAAEQLASLLAYVTGLPPGKSLSAKVEAAEVYLELGDVSDACSVLGALGHEAAAQDGKKLTAVGAAHIEDAAAQIRSVLGC